MPLADLELEFKNKNSQLEEAKQLPLIRQELIGARSYTGPLFVKYNAVLRGLQSDSAFLKNTMVALCCPSAVAEEYQVWECIMLFATLLCV